VGLTAAPVAPAAGTTVLNVTLAGGLRRPVGVYPPGAATVAELPLGDLAVGLPVGATAVVYALDAGGPPFVVAPLPGTPSDFNHWGKH
jgi:hypothetical protein